MKNSYYIIVFTKLVYLNVFSHCRILINTLDTISILDFEYKNITEEIKVKATIVFQLPNSHNGLFISFQKAI